VVGVVVGNGCEGFILEGDARDDGDARLRRETMERERD